MSKSNFILGYPIEFEKLCLVYPPKVKEVLTAPDYHAYLKMLTLTQEEIEDEYSKNEMDLKDVLTPFEYVLNGAYNNAQFKAILERAFSFFIHEPIIILPESKQIILGSLKEIKNVQELRVLDEAKFFDFQNLIRESVGDKTVSKPDPNEHPRIKAMKAKARLRDRVKAKKEGLKIETVIASISCMQMGLNPLNIGELSYAAIPILMSIYQEQEKYRLDIESLLAGADSKKVKPKYWIRNLED